MAPLAPHVFPSCSRALCLTSLLGFVFAPVSNFAMAAEAVKSKDDAVGAPLQPTHLSFHAEYRPRYVHQEGHNFMDGGATNTVAHRARLGITTDVQPWLGMRLTIQDIRVFGTEFDTLWDYSADGLDLFEGNVFFSFMPDLTLRIGRMPLALENHRIVGDRGFFQNTKTFDGAQLVYDARPIRFEIFYAKILEDVMPPANDVDIVAANLHFTATPYLEIGLLGLADFELVIHQSGLRRQLWTVGALVQGHGLGLAYGVEAYWQKGRLNALERAEASLVAAQIAYDAPIAWRPRLSLHTDWVSGDDDTADSVRRVFDTPYASNHAFYGATDFFLDLPKDTLGKGLIDLGFAIDFSPLESEKRSAQDALRFRLQARTFRSGRTPSQAFGDELSVHARWQIHPALELEAMYAAFLRGALFSGTDAHENFMYFSVHANTEAILW